MIDQQIINTYAAREMTIREIAAAFGRSYQNIRNVLTRVGYHNTKQSTKKN